MMKPGRIQHIDYTQWIIRVNWALPERVAPKTPISVLKSLADALASPVFFASQTSIPGNIDESGY